jgi:predicted amidohydrolase
VAVPAAAEGPKPNTKVRVFAMGAKLNMRWLESRQTYRDYIFALADRAERGPAKPVIVEGADDMASHRTGSDLVVWPESIGLFASLTGPRAQPARESGSLEGSIVSLAGIYAKENQYYGAKFPELPGRVPFTRLLAVSLTDTFGRTFLEPFAEMADRYDVWLATVGDMVRDWQIVCTSKAAFTPPPTGEQCVEENPQKVMQLGDPSEPERNYAYEATAPNPSVVAFVFNPDGKLVEKRVKSYITPTELGQDEGALGLDLVPGAVSDSDAVPVDAPVGRLAFVISKPAWMPDVLQKIDQRHTDLLLQPEFFVGDLTRTTGMWSPDTLLASGYNDVLRHPSLETLVHPQMEGGVFSFYADQPSHLAVKPRTGSEKKGFILGQPGHPGLVQTLPWVVPDPVSPNESIAARRKRLGEAGEKLAPGSGEACPDPARPGPCEDGHTEGVLWRDLVVNRTPAYRRYRGGLARTPFSPSRPLARSRREQRNVAVAAKGRHVVAAYEERRGARDQVLVVHSRDGGRRWSKPVRATGRPAGRTDEWWPAVAVSARGRVTVAWVDGSSGRERVYYSRSSNHGRRFGPPRPLDGSAPATAAQWKPALAADDRGGNVVHAAFVDERELGRDDLPQAHVYYSRIEKGKASEGERLDTGEPKPLATKFDNSWAPSIASRGRRVLVAWLDFLNYDWDVFSRASADGGKSWRGQRLVNDTPDEDEELADTPRAALWAAGELVAWTDWRKRDSSATRPHQMYDIYMSRGPGKNLQVDPYGAKQLSTFAPDVCAVGRRDALVAFQDASRGQNDIRAVYVRGARRGRAHRVDDAGPRAGNAWRPRIACSGGAAVALWEDERDGPAQIYFARAPVSRLRR